MNIVGNFSQVVVVYVFNPSTREAETDGSPWVPGQPWHPEPHRETLTQRNDRQPMVRLSQKTRLWAVWEPKLCVQFYSLCLRELWNRMPPTSSPCPRTDSSWNAGGCPTTLAVFDHIHVGNTPGCLLAPDWTWWEMRWIVDFTFF